MTARLRNDIEATHSADALPYATRASGGNRSVARIVEAYAKGEGARHLHRLAKDARTLYGGVFGLLLDTMATTARSTNGSCASCCSGWGSEPAPVQSAATLKERIRETFTPIYWPRSVAEADREAGLGVEVIDAGMAFDTPTYVLVGPWIIAGLAFPPDDRFPSALLIEGEVRTVHSAQLSGLGSYGAVSRAPLGSHLPSQAHARNVAERFAPGFRRAVLEGRALMTAGTRSGVTATSRTSAARSTLVVSRDADRRRDWARVIERLGHRVVLLLRTRLSAARGRFVRAARRGGHWITAAPRRSSRTCASDSFPAP